MSKMDVPGIDLPLNLLNSGEAEFHVDLFHYMCKRICILLAMNVKQPC